MQILLQLQLAINNRLIMKKCYKKRSGVSIIIVVLGLMAIFACAGLVIDLGMVLLTQGELQKAVETSALAGAAALEPERNTTNNISIDTNRGVQGAQGSFSAIRSSNPVISSAIPVFEYNNSSKAVRVTASASAGSYFMSALGIRSITVNARAAAVNSPGYPDPDFPKTPSVGSVVQNDVSGNIGNIYYAPDGQVTNFGSAGDITIRMPMGLVDNPGADLYISQPGTPQGYFLYIGVDNDPSDQWSGIRWVNVSCTGTPASGGDIGGAVGAYLSDVIFDSGYKMIRQVKFYGSGLFDIGKQCFSNGTLIYDGSIVKTAKYIKISDDGTDDGFSAGAPVVGTGLPGIGIDAIGVLHHSRLIKSSDYDRDSDGDGLIDVLEDMIGTNKNSTDSDGDGFSDGIEYVGHNAGSAITSGQHPKVNYNCALDPSG